MEKPSPALRMFELLDLVCASGQPFSLADAVRASGWPKPSVHRMLAQLETGGLITREPGGRLFAPAARLVRLAENVLSADTRRGVRHAVLRQLVADVGESCNLTALSGAEVMYLDRVEAAFPLRMELKAGTRVPIHCSASGKLFLAHMPPSARAALLDGLPLPRYTATTLVQRQALDDELAQILRQGYAVDAEEFVDGLVCVAVPVEHSASRLVRTAVALQAPAARMPLTQALQHVPALLKAATALGRTLV
jgi:IclR family transcriptional regulator, acetate operon repressor